MPDQQIISLLQEIRDLQRQQIENSKHALANQQKAIATQQNYVSRARTMLMILCAIVVALYLLPLVWWGLGWGLRCALRR